MIPITRPMFPTLNDRCSDLTTVRISEAVSMYSTSPRFPQGWPHTRTRSPMRVGTGQIPPNSTPPLTSPTPTLLPGRTAGASKSPPGGAARPQIQPLHHVLDGRGERNVALRCLPCESRAVRADKPAVDIERAPTHAGGRTAGPVDHRAIHAQ